MDYFVTGATGFVGGAVARQLIGAGHQVRLLARKVPQASPLEAAGARFFVGDVTDKASMRKPMGGADGVFHIAGWYKVGVKDKRPGQAINVEGTRNVLELMGELSIPKGVYTSTLAVFGDTHGKKVDENYRMNGPWLTEYDRTKWEAHYKVAEPMAKAGLPLVIVQPGVVYGPGDTGPLHPLIVNFVKGKLKTIPREAAVCWGHVEDMAAAHLLAMDKGRVGESYITAGPAHTYVEAFEIASKLTGIPAPKRHVSPGTLRFLSRLMKGLERIIEVSELNSSEALRAAAGTTYVGSSEKAKGELGFTARPLAVGLKETLEVEKFLLQHSST